MNPIEPYVETGELLIENLDESAYDEATSGICICWNEAVLDG
ncbi:hypothetical protein [Nocardiopsis alkaliphila]|nr:hypothetical protein [Nocardiopsis alkaliphila]